MFISYFFGIIISYLVGSIPFGYVIAMTKGIDIRKEGSGNIGATNVGRVLGRKYGLIIFVLDLLKGFIIVFLASVLVSKTNYSTTADNLLVALCGLCVIFGHAFPIFLKFKGGKAVATSFGVFLWLSPIPIAIAFGFWVLTVVIFRYVSLGSIISAFVLIVTIIVFENKPFGEGIFITALSIIVASLITVRHTSNIQRIKAGTESKVF